MIKLELCDTQAWFLTQILDNAIDNYDLFNTVDENDNETFDNEFHEEILNIRDTLLKIRGMQL